MHSTKETETFPGQKIFHVATVCMYDKCVCMCMLT